MRAGTTPKTRRPDGSVDITSLKLPSRKAFGNSVFTYRRCLVCGAAFPPNEDLAQLNRGRRIAYDPERGRLWVVCGACRRWSLIPLESRWDALDELERLVRDQGRLLSQTANVGLLRAGGLEVVRVGRAELEETAWWRYGQELRVRRERYRKLASVGTAAAVGVVAGSWLTGGASFFGAWMAWNYAPKLAIRGGRWLRFGSVAWRGRGRCARCGRSLTEVRFAGLGRLRASPGEQAPEVTVTCPSCGGRRGAGLLLSRPEGDRALRRALAYHHFAGAPDRRVESAARLIQVAGGPAQLPARILGGGKAIPEMGRTGALAMEIAVHEERERRLLEMELAELEAHWRREEELAEIIDGELSPAPLLAGARLPLRLRR